ncbi:MAG: cytochrome-c oxidase, cbb3-type subunit I [Planctomycetes bacterium]|nr:cytochrome-c oxidase, cbb3-type subunit I [Planctomycetota bacterium]
MSESSSPAAVYPSVSPNLETFAYDNRWASNFVIATLVWGIVGMSLGVTIALQLAFPAASFDQSWFTYGRLRPLHTNAVIFAFAGNAIFAGIYFSLQRLLKARMFSDKLSAFHFWGWQAVIVAGVITLPLGITSGKEYAELEWPIDIALAAVWIAFGINMFGTIFRRREKHLYVAIWFYIATWLGIFMLHVVNSVEYPVTLFKSYPVYAGIQDAMVQWWYGHNAVAFFLTTPFLGIMYYYIPKAAERPVYSYRLSIVHYWSLIFIYIWAGPHHLLHTALPEWAQTLGVVFSVMLIAPSWGGMINGLLTLRGAWDKVRESAVLKFLVAAVTFYGMATFEGCLLAIREVNALSHNTDWTIGHVHNGALGWVALISFGMIYWMIPKMYKTKLWSEGLANVHFWLATIGIGAYAIAMWIAGITAGSMQLAFDEAGRLAYTDWMEIVNAIVPFYWVRFGGGCLFLLGMILCAFNIWRTIAAANTLEDDVVQAPARLPMPRAVSVEIDQALREKGWGNKTNALHDLVERWPTAMVGLSVVVLAIGGICELGPTIIQGAVAPRIATVTPYTPLELTGRDIYIREGCSVCHTQMIRTLRAEMERYGGQYSRAGEFIYDRPFLWGSKRTGPDLARIGVLKPGAAWHYDHMERPKSVSPGSIMPNYPWLISDDMDLSSLERKLKVLASFPMNTPYSPEEIRGAVESAKKQAKTIGDELRGIEKYQKIEGLDNKEIIALIAYLKRLGTDLNKKSSEATAVKAGN